MSDDQLLTVDEVATMLRVDPQTVRKWLRQGILPGFRVSPARKSGWRLRRSEIEQYLESQRGEGAAA